MKFKIKFIRKIFKKRRKRKFEIQKPRYYFPEYLEKVRRIEEKRKRKFTLFEKIIILVEIILIIYFLLAYLGFLPFF